jgi:hypothetical protein
MHEIVGQGAALCVLLKNGNSNTPHRESTNRQNKRMRDKTSATNFGELKKLSREDLEESFKRKGIPEDHAKKLAECLVDEAEQKAKQKNKKKDEGDLDDTTEVRRVGECLPGDLLVWLDEMSRVPAAAICRGARITGAVRTMPVVRVDSCLMDFVQIGFDGAEVRLTPEHRVRTASGRLLRADRIYPGEVLATHHGPRIVTSVLHDAVPELAFSIGMGEPFECRIGSIGLWVELAYRGVPVDRIEVLDCGVRGLCCTAAVVE